MGRINQTLTGGEKQYADQAVIICIYHDCGIGQRRIVSRPISCGRKEQEMNVVLLAPTPPPYGGIAVWTDRMKKAKLKNGWKVKVVDEKIYQIII